jgi:dTDP-4-dehydrorhamnose reductase
MKIHLIGSNGFIGRKLLPLIEKTGLVYCYSHTSTTSKENLLELTMPEKFNFNKIQEGDFVIFLAAVSSPDLCEKDYNFAYSINVLGTKKYIRRILDNGAHILFFSSDVVIGATEKVCDEKSNCHPIGNYAHMKREIEEAFMNFPNFKVFRLSYVFSREDKFTRYLSECDRNGQTAEVFDALKRNVIYLYDVLDAVQKLSCHFTEFNNTIFNLSGPELLSRKDLAELYRQTVSLEFKYNVVAPPQDFFIARPNIIETTSLYLADLLGRNATTLNDAFLQEFNGI